MIFEYEGVPNIVINVTRRKETFAEVSQVALYDLDSTATLCLKLTGDTNDVDVEGGDLLSLRFQ
jgi:hypothetical protein